MEKNTNKLFQIELADSKIKCHLNETFYGKISRENNLCVIHSHGQPELFFIEKGAIKITTISSSESYEGPCLIIIPPNLFHFVETDSFVYNMFVTLEKRTTSRDIKLYEHFQNIFSSKIIQRIKVDEFIPSLLKEIDSQTISAEQNEELIITLFKTLLLKLINLEENTKYKNNITDYSHEISEFIDLNYNKNVKIKDLATILFLSERQVSRLTQKFFNKSFSELLIDKRLAVASFLLTNTDYSIKSIIQITGFESATTFFYIFKKHYHTTPKKYRTIEPLMT